MKKYILLVFIFVKFHNEAMGIPGSIRKCCECHLILVLRQPKNAFVKNFTSAVLNFHVLHSVFLIIFKI